MTIICSDPFKYGEEKKLTFSSDIVSFTNQGTAEADPIFEMEVLKPTTFAMVQNQDKQHQMIGRPIDVDSIAIEDRELILNSPMNTTVGWTAATQVDNGDVQGVMISTETRFMVSDFGYNTEAKWHGPALKTSLSEQLQDFRVEALIENFNGPTKVGRVELYLLDAANQIIGNITMTDAWEKFYRNRARSYARSGSYRQEFHRLHETTTEAGEYELWNDFDGILRLERIENRWTAYVAQRRPDGSHYRRETKRFTDTENLYMDKVAQVQVHIGKFGGNDNSEMSFKSLKVWKINNPDDHQIPYIAYEGDKITFDHENDDILINGEPRLELKDFGGQYFKLTPGLNQVVVQPSDSFNTRVKYLERYR
jgi:hypothetical protein